MQYVRNICCVIFIYVAGGVLCFDLTKVGNKFYCFSDIKTNWYNAMLQCHKLGLHLAIVQDQREQQELTNYLNSTKSLEMPLHWLDGTDQQHESQWIWWSTGDPIIYSAWSPVEPNNFHGNEHCLVIHSSSSTASNWIDIPCNRTDPNIICQLNTDMWKKLHLQSTSTVDGYQFYFHKYNLWATWSESQELCKKFGMELAEIDSKEKNTYLITLLKIFFSTSDKNFWLGGVRNTLTGNWNWIQSRREIERLTPLPSHDGCLDMRLSGDLHETRCNYKQRFICQLKVNVNTDNCTSITTVKKLGSFFQNNGLLFLILLIASHVIIIFTTVFYCLSYRQLNQRFLLIKSNYIAMTKGGISFGDLENPTYDDVLRSES